jgi:hypothetical protein
VSVNVSIPEDLYRKAAEIAREKRVSVDEIFVAAFVEQLAASERFRERAARGERQKFLDVLGKVPDIDPDEHDRF